MKSPHPKGFPTLNPSQGRDPKGSALWTPEYLRTCRAAVFDGPFVPIPALALWAKLCGPLLFDTFCLVVRPAAFGPLLVQDRRLIR